MLSNLPLYIPILFIATTFITYFLFIGAARKNNSNRTIAIISIVTIIWLTIQAALAKTNFYVITDTLPPRFALIIVPPLLLIVILFITRRGKKFIDSLSMKVLTLLHVIRVFVELVLWFLFTYKFVPELMTFEGRNYDILAGLTAPFIVYYGFVRKKLSNTFLIAWNVFSLLLLINIVVNAVLSAPSKFQQFAFDQPNVAVLHYPFVWLPCFIVPVVLFSHLVVLRRLLNNNN